MRLPLLVVSRLAAHNLLATHAMTVPVPEGSEAGPPADPADVPDLLACLFAAQQRRVDKFREFRRHARLSARPTLRTLTRRTALAALSTLCSQTAT